jgi:PKD repeat protein
MAWVYPITPAVNSAFLFCRAGSTVAGFRYGAATDAQGRPTLGYSWNNDSSTTGWNSGLVPPSNQWSLITLVVSPTNAIIYLMNTNGTQAAAFPHDHANAPFDGVTLIGSDSYAQSRTFEGLIDEATIFNTCLAAAQVQNLFNAGMRMFINPPQLVQPPAGLNVYAGTTARLSFTATGDALQYQWKSGAVGSGVFTNFPLGSRFSLGANGALVISNVMLADQLDYAVTLSNSAGAAVSGPATLMVRQPDLAASAVLGCGPVAFYELNELGNPAISGVVANDNMGSFNGTYGTTAQNGFNGYAGPRPPTDPGFCTTNTALKATANDANCIITLPNLNLNTNTVTLVAWIKPNTLANDRGIVYCRGNGTTAGLCMGNHGDNAVGYNWNDNPNAYNYDSGLIPNLNEWAMVALVVSPGNAVLYLMSPSKGILAATNSVANVTQSFANPTTVGTDVYGAATRAWDGGIDDVSIYNFCLSRAQLTSLFTAGSGVGAPTASFTLGPTRGLGSVTVDFTNTTTGTVVSGLWSFGDGATSSDISSPRIQHTYAQPGCVAATNFAILTVTNSGWVSTFTNPNPVSVYPPAPAPIFGVSALKVSTNEAVVFTNLTTGCASTWLWSFGDGATSTLVDPTHAYTAAGTFIVTLAATNAYRLGAVTSSQAIAVTNLASPPIIRPASVLIASVSILQATNVQLVGSNFPASANAPFHVLWTTNLSSAGLGWLTNSNITGDRAFNGTDGRFTNVVVHGAVGTQSYFRIQAP